MIDCDDVCAGKWNIDVIRDSFSNSDDWDCLSFNRDDYYDIWALIFDEYIQHCWGFNDSRTIVNIMKYDITRKLDQCTTNTIEVMSAFNGFAIYKTQRFHGYRYNGSGEVFDKLFTDSQKKRLETYIYTNFDVHTRCISNGQCGMGEVCEHLFYHISAYREGRKIKISKSILC
tara:strand:- start:4 stop:522 length:519 start_codon:yes stop_codon:yes gene_type:complete